MAKTSKRPLRGVASSKQEGRTAMEPATVNMNTMISLSAFRTVNAGLSSDDKELAIRQAFTLFDELYAHLPLKKAMHAVDPVQRLMVMTQRLQQMSDESEFHRQMMTTFISVQDLHTNYLLPDPYRTAVAFQPFMIDEYYDEAGIPHYPVVRMMPQAIQRPFEPGVEITHWNGMPMANAVALNASDHAGSNPSANHLQGLLTMTTRPLLQTLPPREDWVMLTYIHRGGVGEIRYPWSVFQPQAASNEVPANDSTCRWVSDARPRYRTGAGPSGTPVAVRARIRSAGARPC